MAIGGWGSFQHGEGELKTKGVKLERGDEAYENGVGAFVVQPIGHFLI